MRRAPRRAAASENKPLPDPTSRKDFPRSPSGPSIRRSDFSASAMRSSSSTPRNRRQFLPKPKRLPVWDKGSDMVRDFSTTNLGSPGFTRHTSDIRRGPAVGRQLEAVVIDKPGQPGHEPVRAYDKLPDKTSFPAFHVEHFKPDRYEIIRRFHFKSGILMGLSKALPSDWALTKSCVRAA